MLFHTLKTVAIIIIILFSMNGYASVAIETPCTGPSNMLSLINRPTIADSACVMPNKSIMLEMGYEYQKLLGNDYAHILPYGQFRLGLPFQIEFTIIVPNYIHQTAYPFNGTSPATVGVKHTVMSTPKWVGSIELLVTPRSGSNAFGSNHNGAAFNGISSYDISEQFNISMMLGISSEAASRLAGGQSFVSINPDIVFTWQPFNTLDIFAEVYGQTRAGPHIGPGYNLDTGIIYLIRKNITIDIEVGQRLSGKLLGFNHYVGMGLAVKI